MDLARACWWKRSGCFGKAFFMAVSQPEWGFVSQHCHSWAWILNSSTCSIWDSWSGHVLPSMSARQRWYRSGTLQILASLAYFALGELSEISFRISWWCPTRAMMVSMSSGVIMFDPDK